MRVTRLLWLAILLAMSSCNLSRTPPTPEAIPTNLPNGSPEATITAPEDGDEVVVDTQIFVTGRATDPVGITRVQLLANGQIVKTVSSESPAGQNTFDVLLDYTPHAIGSVDLQLIAYRGALASDPAEITINVRSNQAQVTATIQQIPNVPVIDPNDHLSRPHQCWLECSNGSWHGLRQNYNSGCRDSCADYWTNLNE